MVLSEKDGASPMKPNRIYLVIAAAVLLLAGSCKRYSRPGDPHKVVYAMYADMKDWDPAAAYSLEVMALGNIYEPLHWFVPDSGGGYHFRPALATGYNSSSDGLRWTFHLRRGVTFHDGQPFTSRAVKKSVERVLRLGKGAAYIWRAVKSIKTPDDSTVVFSLSYPAPLDLIAASQYASWIMSPAIADCTEAFFRKGRAAGTGPYRLKEWKTGDRVELEKFPEYWGGWDKPHFSNVVLKIISEAATRVQMIRRGDIDFAGLIPTENIAAMRHNPDLSVEIVPSWRNMMFLLNTDKAPTNNIYLRRAILHAFDYRAAVEYILEGMAERPVAPVPQNMWGHADDLTQPEFDLNKARALLKKSGLKAGDIHLRLAYVASVDAYEKCALMLQNNLQKIGIQLELEPGLWNVLWDKAKNPETAPHIQSMTWWPSYPTPGDWLNGLFHTQSPNLFNLSHYHNTVFDSLVDGALALEALNRPAAVQRYQQAQRLLYEEAVALFFADLKVRFVQRRSVSPLKPNPAYEMIYFYNLYRKQGRS